MHMHALCIYNFLVCMMHITQNITHTIPLHFQHHSKTSNCEQNDTLVENASKFVLFLFIL